MPLLNYTTKVPAHKSIAEISQMLAKAGARQIMHQYDNDGSITGLAFSIELEGQQIGFRLPTDWRPIQPIMEELRRKNSKIGTFVVEREHCINLAWRITKDWVEAQLAIIEIKMVKPEQVFLPYMVQQNGRTLYENAVDSKFLLAAPNQPN